MDKDLPEGKGEDEPFDEESEELLGGLEGTSGLADLFGTLFSGTNESGASKTLVSSKISGKALIHWTNLTELKELRLNHCPNLSDKDLKPLAQLTHLEILDLSGSNITGDVFKYTKDMASVRELVLLDCPRLSDKGLKHLSHLPNLEVLKISGAQITGSCFKDWKTLSRLRELEIIGCPKLIDKNLRYLNELSSLVKVDLSGKFV